MFIVPWIGRLLRRTSPKTGVQARSFQVFAQGEIALRLRRSLRRQRKLVGVAGQACAREVLSLEMLEERTLLSGPQVAPTYVLYDPNGIGSAGSTAPPSAPYRPPP